MLSFAKIPNPLNEKTSDEVKFAWYENMQNGFEDLKLELTSAPYFAYPDYDKSFVPGTDESRGAVSAALSQTDDNSRDRPINTASRALSSAELNYSALDGEALAVIFALKIFALRKIELIQTVY